MITSTLKCCFSCLSFGQKLELAKEKHDRNPWACRTPNKEKRDKKSAFRPAFRHNNRRQSIICIRLQARAGGGVEEDKSYYNKSS